VKGNEMKIYICLSLCFIICLSFVTALGQSSAVVQIDGGQNYMCAVLSEGSLYCWGRLDWMGVGDFEGVWQPTLIADLENVAEVSSGSEFICVRKKDSTVWCLGDGANGRLGNGSDGDSTTPVQVVGINTAIRVVSGFYHACALLSDGTVYCWGKGGELGVSNFANARTPIQVESLTNIIGLAIAKAESWGGGGSTCALAQSGQLYCWGENREGALGTDDGNSSRTPLATITVPNATRIYGNGQHFCVLSDAGAVTCWGANYDGQLGNGRKGETKIEPAPVSGLGTITALALGDSFTCALDSEGTVSCWGKNVSGQLGRGYRNVMSSDPGNPLISEVISDLNGVKVLGVGNRTACAVNHDGVTYCWGDNSEGSIGTGAANTQEAQLEPTPVRW
jgi:alpha-tubulin suppressor-like RCC1 family protein